jgi:hypothetical protein
MTSQAKPTLEEVRRLIGTYSIASLRNWLKRCDLPHSANTRNEIAARVHGLLEKGDLTLPGLTAAMIGIEEASSKRTYMYRIPTAPTDLSKIDKQLTDLKVVLVDARVPASDPTSKTKIVYALNSPEEVRIKWTEMHKRVEANRRTRTFQETNVPKIVVLIVNKATGLVQIRYDHPEDEHSHSQTAVASPDDYYAYFKEQSENVLGHALESLDLRISLEKVLKTTPRIVRSSYVVDESADGGLTRRTQRQQHKDVRDLDEWEYITTAATVRTFEEAPVRWQKEMACGSLTREVPTRIYAKGGIINFDADCYEEEIEYVLRAC